MLLVPHLPSQLRIRPLSLPLTTTLSSHLRTTQASVNRLAALLRSRWVDEPPRSRKIAY